MKRHFFRSIDEMFEQLDLSSDFYQFAPSDRDDRFMISCYISQVDKEKLHRYLLPVLKSNLERIESLEDIPPLVPFECMDVTEDSEEVLGLLMNGYIAIRMKDSGDRTMLVDLNNATMGHRRNNDTENEFSVVGPKVGFVENLDVNLHLLRQKLATSQLVFETIKIGSLSHTRVVIAYLDGITNPRHIRTVRQRLESIDFDVVFDNSLIDQIISDHSNTPFPLFLSTERIDRVVYAITSGQTAILADGSPYVITGPSTFLDFFVSPEDYFLPWIVGSFFRVIRIISVFFSVFATPLYVAILTYHFEVIPENLLEPLVISREHVPFPPVLEVIFLETTIELLREAGARLPSKIGQTLGIVGGIVIGQASVQAALTSNILLIIVALSALASFTTPIFKMANTIRLLRFPFILLAAMWGGLGILVGFVFLLGHLLRLKSLGTSYLLPLYPFRKGNFADSLLRTSYQNTTKRSGFLKPLTAFRYKPRSRSSKESEDIDNE